MTSVSRLVPALAALSTAFVGVAPAFAQASAPVQHVRVYYQPASSTYCIDTAEMDAGATGVTRLPSFQCKSQAEWAQDGLTVSRI
ncbi:hypothetical protein [Sphingomonas oryzagri]|uniref:Ricin B lectin domain-containing protein n=1 Tax=Sphingomonas oryzagri TaxID=3042314 RepID=A0ABT6N391_9SPHN|nr:hypothetical protein [Sphingomonas oryzagri]MDH7638841.1 hypothetical protein [Sphingomonas oryzagri]